MEKAVNALLAESCGNRPSTCYLWKAMPITVINGRAFVPETLLLGAHLKAVIAPTYDDPGARVCTAALSAATQDGKPRKGPL